MRFIGGFALRDSPVRRRPSRGRARLPRHRSPGLLSRRVSRPNCHPIKDATRPWTASLGPDSLQAGTLDAHSPNFPEQASCQTPWRERSNAASSRKTGGCARRAVPLPGAAAKAREAFCTVSAQSVLRNRARAAQRRRRAKSVALDSALIKLVRFGTEWRCSSLQISEASPCGSRLTAHRA